jgi:hypothetical protein
MAPGECLPEQNAGRPDVGRGAGGLSGQPLRGDIRERSRHIAGRGQRLLLEDQRQPEVQDAHGHVRPVGEQDVRGLDIAMDDPRRVGVGQPVQDLRGRLDGGLVVELAVLERVPERPSRNELVGDVDVSLVARERVGAQAGRMLELRGRSRLALGARTCRARTGDDLERDLTSLALVEGVPDRPHAAASERLERPVPAEHEPARSSVKRGLGHSQDTFPADGRTPFACEEWATVGRIPLQSA